MLRIPLIICLFITSAYGCGFVLLQDYPLYFKGDWKYYFFAFAPWVCLILMIKSWHRCYIWRRMLDARAYAPVLSRGGHKVINGQAKPSILERLCLGLVIFALAALLKTLFIKNIAWWLGALVMACLLLRIVTIAVRRT